MAKNLSSLFVATITALSLAIGGFVGEQMIFSWNIGGALGLSIALLMTVGRGPTLATIGLSIFLFAGLDSISSFDANGNLFAAMLLANVVNMATYSVMERGLLRTGIMFGTTLFIATWAQVAFGGGYLGIPALIAYTALPAGLMLVIARGLNYAVEQKMMEEKQ